ncbi:MAG TPA: energy transducer TonB [Thermoanaerobaculia bacterium]|jgi:TonB family protein
MAQSTRVRLVSLLILLLAMTTLSPAQARADVQADVQAQLEKAQQLYSAGNYRGACKAYQRADELAQGKSSPSLIGLSDCLYIQDNDAVKSLVAARQALAVAATPDERTKATEALGLALLRQPGEASWTEAVSLFKGQVDSSGGAEGQGGLLSALLALHRDQEAAEILQSLRKQGLTEDDIQQHVLDTVEYHGPREDTRRFDDFNERLLRLDPNAPLRVGGGVSRPQIIRATKSQMPAGARSQLGMNATVIIEAIIDTQGYVHFVKVLKPQPHGLTEAAVDAVKAWTFHPATLNGKPVAVWYILTVNFRVG